MEEVIPYRKLTGRARVGGLLSYAFRLLYEGPDHLLLMETTSYSDDYKRFYFRDIQSIAVQKTNRYRKLNIGLASALLICIFLIPAGVAIQRGFGANPVEMLGLFLTALGSVPLPFVLVALIVNLAKGETCRTIIQTAVQTEELTPLRRLRKASRIVPQLRERIEAAQGALTQEQLATITATVWPGASATAAPPPPQVPPTLPPPLA